ncbi:hypothetical protein N0V86_000625 [Didymella sp. IMI 355093]|nr:hypothetical protein N0V86_000625 [Didymella sp. IMI 355093]
MSPFQTLLLVSLALLNFAVGSRLPKIFARAPPETPGRNRRGVAYNDAGYLKYFSVPGSHVTWTYNWDSGSSGGNTAGFEYVPMLHSNHPDHTGKWVSDVQNAAFGNKNLPTHLLGFNEPDNCESGMGGACMDVGTAVAAWKQWMDPQKALKEKMYLGSPAVTNGANGLKYLSSFIDACGRPIWITEFRARGSNEQVKKLLDEVLPWLDASGDIHRYAYFMATKGDGLLIDNGEQSLSNVGTHYTFHT